jgi:predicted RNase H-like HicB family nuclease
MTKYTVIIEKAGNNYSAYCPDLPGCVAAAKTVEETIALMTEAIKTHLDLMIEDDIEIPEPTTRAVNIEVTV